MTKSQNVMTHWHKKPKHFR